jgi:peptide subunit release factor 1 (eRF1)
MANLKREQLRTLKSFRANGHPVISVYWTLKRGPSDATLLELKNMTAVADDVRTHWRNAASGIERDLGRIYRFAEEQQTHGSPTTALAIFACGPANFWEVHELNAPVRDRVVVAEAPFVRPLVRLLSEQQPYEIVLSDHANARFFLWREGNVEPHGELSTDVPREDEIHRMAQDQFRHHQQDWQHKHVKQTSERLLSHLQGQNFKGLWVGAKEDVARALESNLHSYLKEKWCGQFPIDIHASESEIRERVAPLIEAHERKLRADLMQRLETAAKSGGVGAIGLEDTLTEFQLGKVMTLLIERNFAAPGGRCTNCGSLTLVGAKPCPYCSSKVKALKNVVDELSEEAFINGAEVIFVPEGEGLEKLGHIGTLLRFG